MKFVFERLSPRRSYSRNTGPAPKLLFIIFLFVGIAAIVAAVYFAFDTSKLLKEGAFTKGVVVELVEHKSRDTSSHRRSGTRIEISTGSDANHEYGYSYSYSPKVEFIDGAGKKFAFQSSMSSNPPAFSVGEQVDVIYPKDNPSTAKIKSTMSLWGLSIILGGMGIVFMIIGFIGFVSGTGAVSLAVVGILILSSTQAFAADVNQFLLEKLKNAQRINTDTVKKIEAENGVEETVTTPDLSEVGIRKAIKDYAYRRNQHGCDSGIIFAQLDINSISGMDEEVGGYKVNYGEVLKCGNDSITQEHIDIWIRILPSGEYEAFKPEWVERGEDEMSREMNKAFDKMFDSVK